MKRMTSPLGRTMLGSALLCVSLVAAAAPPPDTKAPPPMSSETSAVATLEALWTALKDHYPMMEYMGARGDEWLDEFRPKVAAAPDLPAAYDLMDELVCRLNDYHTRFFAPDGPRRSSPPVRVEPVLKGRRMKDEGRKGAEAFASFHPFRPVPYELPEGVTETFAFAVTWASPDVGVRAGDEVVSVDGVPVGEALKHAWKHGVGSSEAGKLRGAAWWMLRGDPDTPVRLGVRRKGRGGVVTVEVPRKGGAQEPVISDREVEGIPVLKIRGWGDGPDLPLIATFDRLLEQYRDRRGIVFDVRDNGGGLDHLADEVTGRFLKERVVSSISFHRNVPGLEYRRTVEWAEPRGPWRFAGRVAVLTNEGCMSACEHFVSGMSEAGALVVGTPTSGACGWIRGVDLPGGARVNVSQTFPLHTAGIPSPLLGIAPHVWTPVTLSDLRAGRDAALGAALKWIGGDEPLPVRSYLF